MPRSSGWQHPTSLPMAGPNIPERNGQLRTSFSQSSSLPHYAISHPSYPVSHMSPLPGHQHTSNKMEISGITDHDAFDLLEDPLLEDQDEDVLYEEDQEEALALGPPQDAFISPEGEPMTPLRSVTPTSLLHQRSPRPWDTQDGKDDDDGGAMLAQLMKLNEGLRSGKHIEPVTRSSTYPVSTSQVVSDTQAELSGASIASPGTASASVNVLTPDERRKLAVEYLENICKSFLQQLHASQLNVFLRNQTKMDKKNKKSTAASNKRKKLSGDDSQSSGEGSLETDSQGRKKGKSNKSSQASVQDAPIGITITTKNRKTGADQVIHWPESPITFDGDDKETVLVRMTRVLQVASILYAAVLEGVPTTKRDIFYSDVSLFKHQRVVDKIIDDMIASAGLKRADFNVCASAKGLVASNVLRIFLKTGEEVSLSASLAALIPPIERIERVEMAELLSYVLIVEKDAVFNTLCGAKLLEQADIGYGILITGKGYPDLSTLQLISRIATDYPGVGMYALVDGDPHGLDILSTYTFGSQASKHSHDYEGLNLGERLEWIGVRISELTEIGVGLDDMVPLSDRDWGKALAMLRNRPDMPTAWKRELSAMLHLNRKAEIEVIQSAPGPIEEHQALYGGRNKLVDYIIKRLQRR